VAELRVSQLAVASTATEADYVMIVQNGVNKRLSLGTLLKNLNSNDVIRINPLQRPVNTVISSKENSALVTVDGVNDRIGINEPNPDVLLHINGVVKIGGASNDGLLLESSEVITHPVGTPVSNYVLNILRETSALEIFGACTYILNAGIEGQTKYVYLKSIDTGGSTAVISVIDGLGFNRIQLSGAVGQALTLKFVNGKWICVGNNNAILYTE